MVEVINLADVRKEPTKQIKGMDGPHRYVVQFDPNAPPGERWVWYIDYVVSYRYVGSNQTQDQAVKAARRKIHLLNRREEEPL